jgi:hypothetical protein
MAFGALDGTADQSAAPTADDVAAHAAAIEAAFDADRYRWMECIRSRILCISLREWE